MRQSIETRLKAGENKFTEFKTSFQKEAIETVIAFANANGGDIFVGVKDNGSVAGINLHADIVNSIKKNTEPRIFVDIEEILVRKKTVLKIHVDEYPMKPVACKGRYFIRRSNSNHQMTPQEISDTHMRMLGGSWDYFADVHHSIEDIDEENILKFMKLADIEDSIENIYRKFDLIKDGRPTFGCYLLFNNNDRAITTNIEIGRFQTETVIKDSLSINGALLNQVDAVMDFIYKHINKAYVITGKPQRDEVWDYPMDAIREIVTNMIVHRDYRSSGHTTVKIFDDKIEFFNFGKLPDDLSLENIKSGYYKSHPRNIQIAEVFKTANIIEKYGSGIKRVIDAFREYGLKEPFFEPMMGGLNVTVYKAKNREEINEGVNVGVDVGVDVGVNVGVNELFKFIVEHQPVRTNTLISTFNTVTQRTIERWLKILKDESKIVYQGSPKTGGYVVATKSRLET